MDAINSEARIAVLVPCLNEESTIGQVVDDFKRSLPTATVFVYDNASTDRTAQIAKEHGAKVRLVPQRGKGNVVRRMFADIEADVYVLVDGDATYDAQIAPLLVGPVLEEGLDVVSARRRSTDSTSARRGHTYGNRLLTTTVGWLFGNSFSDVLSGYKAMSRRFVKSFHVYSEGFEIETELTIHALELSMAVDEIDSDYYERPAGSSSKLRTVTDGVLILGTILRLVREVRPIAFFGTIGLVMYAVAAALGVPILHTYISTGLVPRFPTAFFVIGLGIVGTVCVLSGLILDTASRARRETKANNYLSIPAPNILGGRLATAHDDLDRRSLRQGQFEDAPGS